MLIITQTEQFEVEDFNIATHKVDYTTRTVVPKSATEVSEWTKMQEQHEQRFIAKKRLDELKIWFTWYDMQSAQALRAARLGEPWTATDEDKTYTTLAELDREASKKQAEIRERKAIGGEYLNVKTIHNRR